MIRARNLPDGGTITYTYDLLHRVEYTEGDSGVFAYEYDTLRRLTGVSRDGSLTTTTYGYDGRGNLVLEREKEAGREHRYTCQFCERVLPFSTIYAIIHE